MPKFDWNDVKDNKLILNRDISFQDVIYAFEHNLVVDIKQNPNQKKYPNQFILLFSKNNYIYGCPFIIQDDGTYFLKTIFPSRKAVKQYLTNK